MNLLGEKQKTKIFSDSLSTESGLDCYIKKYSSSKLTLVSVAGQKSDFSDLIKGDNLDVKVYTPKGILIFSSEITSVVSDNEIEILYNEKDTKLEDTRKNPRYSTDRPITIFRPLLGNIETHLIDISVRGLRFYSEISLEVDSVFEIMLYLSDTDDKVLLKGRVLDKTGLPDGIHRMIIEEISYADRQKLVDFCMSLAK